MLSELDTTELDPAEYAEFLKRETEKFKKRKKESDIGYEEFFKHQADQAIEELKQIKLLREKVQTNERLLEQELDDKVRREVEDAILGASDRIELLLEAVKLRYKTIIDDHDPKDFETKIGEGESSGGAEKGQ